MEERSWAVVHFTTTAYEPRITNFPLFFTMMIMSKTYIAFSTQPQTPQGVAIDENGLMNYSVFAIKRACQQYLLPTRSHGSRPGLLLFFQRAFDCLMNSLLSGQAMSAVFGVSTLQATLIWWLDMELRRECPVCALLFCS